MRADMGARTTISTNGNSNIIAPSVDDQAVSLSDDGTTIIIDFFSFGPSGVRALPLAAGINVGGHY